ncbi:MAG: GNAT family N-acetyltransferase [Candidatus Bathyarchaeota archaeon]|nr:MAG: GNAT family N-acetyltransferase [Candidatus Bathyarchaeota archaeon]
MAPEIVLEAFRGLSLNILIDGKRVGFVDAWEDEKVVKGVWVEYVYILEGLRNSGIGSTAMRMVLERWREMGYESVSLDDVHWDKSQDFWGKLGFQGERKRRKLVL